MLNNRKPLSGGRFGMLTVLRAAGTNGTRSLCLCRCDCGDEALVYATDLRTGAKLSCGCRRRPKPIGSGRYGLLTVLSEAGSGRDGSLSLCRCDCGIEKLIPAARLRSGNTGSCGCNYRKHGHRAVNGKRSPEYQSWSAMRDRCTNPNLPYYQRYGARGITICERWRTFTNFLADMGPRPAGKSLDRIDNDGNYEPGNCRWATRTEQARNRRPRATGRVGV